ncbi:TfoX/Sxy family protein [Mycolicibacterium sp. S2-37]|uniref:TfoX/Sxy family protein n=1 Tax=Mycolicibacterium sp. S2-37 TaxID=2810297 RepID=UPI001A9471F0|nr:TfoX/Sxy family protein [Mycolicibacterium sp. S2-37]MBO0676020.1 TfoX/Sxy family protein [Mycolicibacterium sp. S2-37]
MAYDHDLAHRIRELTATEHGITEKSMFGGLAFLVDGNMAVAASGRGGLMVRVPPEDTETLLRRDHVEPMVMSGRETRGWLRVHADGVRTTRQLRSWVTRGVGYARSLPAK